MHVEKHISALLHQYDCVVVPGFGAFVVNAKSASLNRVNKTFSPPFGKISFNTNIKHNDGLLVNHISQTENIDYKAAVDQVQKQVEKWQQQLNNSVPVNIAHIGTLSFSEKHKLLFHQDENTNYLAESYGLSAFQTIPLPKKEAPVISIKKGIAATAETAPKRKVKWGYVAAAASLLLLIAFGIPFRNKLKNINYSALLPWVDKTPQFYVKRTRYNHLTLPALVKNEDVFSDSTVNIAGKVLSIYIPDKTKVVKDMSKAGQGRYYIIGGCFSKLSNAKRLVERLKGLGFRAKLIGKHKKLYTVAYSNFDTRHQAENALSLAQKDNPKAWILKY